MLAFIKVVCESRRWREVLPGSDKKLSFLPCNLARDRRPFLGSAIPFFEKARMPKSRLFPRIFLREASRLHQRCEREGIFLLPKNTRKTFRDQEYKSRQIRAGSSILISDELLRLEKLSFFHPDLYYANFYAMLLSSTCWSSPTLASRALIGCHRYWLRPQGARLHLLFSRRKSQ